MSSMQSCAWCSDVVMCMCELHQLLRVCRSSCCWCARGRRRWFFRVFLYFSAFSPYVSGYDPNFFHDFLPFLTPHHSAARELEGKRKKIFFAKNAHHPMVASFSLPYVSPRQIRPARAPDSKIAHFHVFSWFLRVFPGKSSIRSISSAFVIDARKYDF